MKNRFYSRITAFLLAVLLAFAVPFSVTAVAAGQTVSVLSVHQTAVNGAGHIRLDWESVPGAKSYTVTQIYAAGTGADNTVTTTSYECTDCTSDAAFFTVQASDENGQPLAVSARLTVAVPPKAPCGACVNDTENGRLLTWSADKDNNAVDFYRIYDGDTRIAETVKPQLLLPDTLTASTVKVTAYRYICGVACEGGSMTAVLPAGETAETNPVKTVTITGAVGETIDLAGIVQPGSLFSVAAQTIAKADDMKIECLQTGETEIYAKGTNRDVRILLRVCKAPSALHFAESEINIAVGEQISLSVPFETGENCYTKTFTSSESAVLRADSDGTLTAVKEGTAVVTVKLFGDISDSLTVHVLPAATRLVLTPSELVLGIGEEIDIQTEAASGEAFNSLRWKYDAEIISFDGQGTVKALKAGNTTLTAITANGVTEKIPVTVTQAPLVLRINLSGIPNLLIGESRQLTVYTNTSGGLQTIKWKTSDEKVAKVENGLVTAVGAGTATVTAETYNGQSVSCSVHVPAPAKKLTLSCEAQNITRGTKFVLTATAPKDSVAGILTFTSSDPSVVKIDENGNCEALKEGTATLTVTNTYGAEAKIEIAVLKAPTAVKLNRTTMKVGVGETKTLTATTDNGEGLDCLTWSSSDPKIASVSEYGTVTAKGAGSAVITVTTFNGLKAECTVTVKNAPKTITLDRTSVAMRPTATVTLEAYVDTGAWSSTLLCTSSNTAVATVTNTGKITAVAPGTCTVTVQVYNGIKTTCAVTVVNSVSSMAFAKTKYEISIGDTVESPVLDQDGMQVSSCVYTSSDTSVATVDTSGNIHAVKMGTCSVTATYYTGLTAVTYVSVGYMDVPIVSQLPTYPTGCEGASAAALLCYHGISASLSTMMSYIPYQEIEYYNGKPYGPDINYTFAGNPKGTYTSGNPGYGIFAPGLTNSIQNAINSTGVRKTAVNISGCTYAQLTAYLAEGLPVIVWSTYHMQTPQTVNWWYVDTTGEYFEYPRGTHVCVLCGYSDEYVYLMDPYDAEIVAYNSTTFQARWNLLDRMAVVVY